MSAVVRSASFPAVAKEAGLAAADVDALQRELASSQQQVAALKAALDAAKMERAAAAAASPAMVTIGGAVLAGFRFARIAHNDRLCKRLYSVTGDVVRALTDVLLKLGYDDAPLATAEEFNRAYYAASGSAQAPNVARVYLCRRCGARRPARLVFHGLGRVGAGAVVGAEDENDTCLLVQQGLADDEVAGSAAVAEDDLASELLHHSVCVKDHAQVHRDGQAEALGGGDAYKAHVENTRPLRAIAARRARK